VCATTHVHSGKGNAYDERLNLRLGVFGKGA